MHILELSVSSGSFGSAMRTFSSQQLILTLTHKRWTNVVVGGRQSSVI